MELSEEAIIFVNYRRADGGWPAGHLADKLQNAFGRDRVFLDVRSIDAGDDFTEEISSRFRLEMTSVLIVVIDEKWLFAQDNVGKRRLDHRSDWVRVEIRAALARKDCRLIPVFVDDAKLPPEKEALPRDIAPLLKRQRFSIRQETSESDIDRLIYEVEKSGFARFNEVSSHKAIQAVLDESSKQVRLQKSKAAAAERLTNLIEVGDSLLDLVRKSRPSTLEELDARSRDWHKWRQFSEQSMRELFTPPMPLAWLKELRPKHLDFEKPLEERAKDLLRDVEKETLYFRNLLQRLDNYERVDE